MLPKNTKCMVKSTAPYFAGRIGYFQFLGTGQAAGVVILSETPITDQVSPGTMLAGSALMSVDHTDVIKLMEMSAQDLAVEETPIAASASTDRDKRNFVLRHKRARPHQYAYSFNPDSKTTKLDHAWILSKALYVQIIFNDPSSAEDWEDYELVSMYDAKQAQAKERIECTAIPLRQALGQATAANGDAVITLSVPKDTQVCRIFIDGRYMYLTLVAPDCGYSLTPDLKQARKLSFNEARDQREHPAFTGSQVITLRQALEDMIRSVVQGTTASSSSQDQDRLLVDIQYPKDTQVYRWTNPTGGHMYVRQDDIYYKGYGLVIELRDATKFPPNFPGRDQLVSEKIPGSYAISFRQALEDMIRSLMS